MGYYDAYLEHHGILGMKWGVRRFEDASGHLTAAGKARYNTDNNGNYKKLNYDNAKLSVKTAKANFKEAKSEYKKSYKTASKDVLNKEKRKYFTESSKKYKDAKKELEDSKAKLKEEKEANKKHLTNGQKVAIAVAAAGAVTVGVLAVKHRKEIAEGAKKVQNVLRQEANKTAAKLKTGQAKAIEKAVSLKAETKMKIEQNRIDRANAIQKGLTEPYKQRRQQHAEAARELAKKFESRNPMAEDRSAGPRQLVENWLNGHNVANEKGINTNSIEYLEDLLRRAGYIRKG